jgi:hypothetical protein
MSLNSAENRGHRVPMFIRAPLIVVALGGALGLPIYWWMDESGLYYVLREWQVDLSGGRFIPLLTVLVCMLVLLFPMLGIIYLLAGLFPKKEPKDLIGELVGERERE